MHDTDRIERHILLRASRSRVWKALTDAEEFGRWFGVNFDAKQFVAGGSVEARVTYPGYEQVTMKLWIERIEPERHFSWQWHPAANDSSVDYSHEPKTRVVFELHEEEGGTRLSVVESGLDQIPLERRAQVFRLNTQGWDQQLVSIEKYVAAR
jgi:uncharacterized protein YndB with AHSA1/START domain